MTTPALGLRHLSFHGPDRPPASLTFGPGLNVIYGASETGKSFVVDAVDFMLGGKQALRDIPQRIGYDRILLGLETAAGEQFTLMRSVDGGAFRAYPGLHTVPPTEGVEASELAEQHSDRNSNNLSAFLLERCDLAGKRIRKNRVGDTNSLSFRNLARLVIVTETEITQQRSPLSDGNLVADTPNFATFKLLLTGVDDSALVTTLPIAPQDQSREAQLELLDHLLTEQRGRLRELTGDPEELDDQLERIQRSLSTHAVQLADTESEYRRQANRRRDLRKRLEEGRDRRSEIASLLERFALLDRHYVSDVARLRGLEEGGTLFEVLGRGTCPLCGADAAHHRREAACEGDVGAVVAAARSEVSKIEVLRRELADTIESLQREGRSFDRRLPKVEQELDNISAEVERLISPKLTALRERYSQFADKRGEIREAKSVFQTIEDIEHRRTELENGSPGQKDSEVAEADLPAAVAAEFSQQVESILKEWHFPDAERVYFDQKSRDLVIAGKHRTARGKGLRAITHAAFTIGLLQYCRTKETPHPGFAILDSPLLAYRAPEGSDDDLSGTDLNEQFYAYLAAMPDDRQVIIVENSDPPTAICDKPQAVMFSKNPHSGRYGFFPLPDGTALPDMPRQLQDTANSK